MSNAVSLSGHSKPQKLVHLRIDLPFVSESAASAIVGSDCMYVPYRHMQEMTAGILFSLPVVSFFQLIWHDSLLQMRMVIPEEHSLIAKSVLFAMQPEAQISEAEDIFLSFEESLSAISHLRYQRSSIYPIRYSDSIPGEPIHYILSALASIPSDVSVVIQTAVQPLKYPLLARLSAFAKGAAHAAGRIFRPECWMKAEQAQTEKQAVRKKGEGEFGLVSILVGTFTNSRQITVKAQQADKEERLMNALEVVESAYQIFSVPGINSLQLTEAKPNRPLNQLYDPQPYAQIMTDFELSCIWAVPKNANSLPVTRVQARELPAPPQLIVEEGLNSHLRFGCNRYRGREIAIGLPHRDRIHHLLVHGKSRRMISNVLVENLRTDLSRESPLLLVTSSEQTLSAIIDATPAHRIDDLMIIDTSDTDYLPGLNLFDLCGREDQEESVSLLNTIFESSFPDRWHNDLRTLFTNACRALISTPYSSLLDLKSFLSDEEERTRILALLEHHELQEYWLRRFPASESLSRASEALKRCLDELLADDTLLLTLAAPFCTGRFDDHLQEGGIVVLKICAEGHTGKSNTNYSHVLSSAFLLKLLASKSRQNLPHKPHDLFQVYLDGLCMVEPNVLYSLAKDARKYNISLNIFTEELHGIPDKANQQLFGAISNYLFFTTAEMNAQVIAKAFNDPTLGRDLQALQSGQFCAKFVGLGEAHPFVSGYATFAPCKERKGDYRECCLAQSRGRFCMERCLLSRIIDDWTRVPRRSGSTHVASPPG